MLALDARARRARREMRRIEDVGMRLAADPALRGAPPLAPPTVLAQLARAHAEVRRGMHWAESRARSMALRRSDVLASCGERWRTVGCGCQRIEMRVGCDQPLLCVGCRRKHSRRWASRITAGLDDAVRAARRRWFSTASVDRRGMLPGVYLITLTGPHTGDLVLDRKRMARALRLLTKSAHAAGWWSSYAATWEATPGTDGAGHLHVHLAVVSSWVPYTEAQAGAGRGLHEAWREALPGALVVDVQPPRKRADGARSAGEYLAKYVTKGVESAGFTGEKAGELLVALRGQRKVQTSLGFWRVKDPVCPCCRVRWELIQTPCSLRALMPGAWLSAEAERSRWRDPGRAPPQPVLRGLPSSSVV